MAHRFLVAAATLGACLWAAEARADAPITLEESVKLALVNNERALKAPLRVVAAEGQLDRARAAFLPSISASGAGALHPLDRNNRVVGATGTLQLNQTLLNLSAFPTYAQARHQLESERWGAVQDKRVLAFDTARAFFVVRTAQGLLDSAKQRIERARASQQNAEARAKAALTSTNDVTLARVDTAAAAREVAIAEGNLARAFVLLGFLVGRSVASVAEEGGVTMRAAENASFRAEDVVKLAEGRRPDVRSAAEKTAALRASANEPLYRLAPTLSLSGQVKLTVDPPAQEKAHDESAQLTLTWSVYDAGVRYADRRTRLAQAQSQALDERLLRRSIAADIGIALATLRAARETFRISGEAVEAARKHTAETEILYQQGLARALELITANGRRYDAEVGRETARLAMAQAYLDLRFASGLEPLEDAAAPRQVTR